MLPDRPVVCLGSLFSLDGVRHGMLWTEKHAPADPSDLPQDDLRRRMSSLVDEGFDVVFYGPEGAGKSAAADLLEPDFVLNASDFFGLTKAEIADDPRFRGFISSKRKRESSKADLINHVLKEVAAQYVGEGRKTILVDDAHAMRRDFQQALRRVMETADARFVLSTNSLSALIPAIESRCYPVQVRGPSVDEHVEVLRGIAEEEDVEYDDAGLEYLANAADGDLREGVLSLQAAASRGVVDIEAAHEVVEQVAEDSVAELLRLARDGEFDDAVEILDRLLVEEGVEGNEILNLILEETESLGDREAAEVVKTLAEVDVALEDGANDRVHLESLVTRLAVQA